MVYIQSQKILGAKPYMDMNPLAIAIHKHKVLFIGVPKVATQTFLNSFYLDTDIRRDYNVELIEKRPTCHTAYAAYPDYYSFTFVRNPWAKALSCYNSKIADPDPIKKARTLSLYKNLKAGMSFLEFTRWLLTEEGRDEIADRHWMSQFHFLTNEQGETCCKDIRRFENFQQELKDIFLKTGINITTLKTLAFQSGASQYHAHYCEEAKQNISKRYAKDIDLLGYTFEE
jgi:hypothetical protein